MERKTSAGKRRSAARSATPSRSRPQAHSARRAAAGRKKSAPSARRWPARRSEAGSIVAGSLVVAAVLVAALGVLALFMPQLRLSRAQSLVNAGQLDAADNLINVLESEGKPQARIDALRLSLAEQRVRAGQYDEALSLAAELPASDRLTEVNRASRYGQAREKYDGGDYPDAAQRFYQLGDYRDSAQRYVDCRCALAVLTWLDGDREAAEKALLALEGAPERIGGVAAQVAGDRAAELAGQELFDGPALARMQVERARLSAARATVKAGRVAAGYRHTVGLRADGTVLAAGNNRFGQCNVSDWTDVIQVAAGAKHTLGLRADGTVLAVGDNSYGQCEVGGWKDVACIAANAYGSFALMRDGTVAASSQYADRVSGWHGATLIAAGAYSAGCLYGQDGMLSTHPGAQLKDAAGLNSLSVCGPVAAGVDEDGRLVCNYKGAPDWTDLACVAAGENGLVGVRRDGTAVAFYYRGQRASELEVEGTAIEAAVSGTHMVVITEEGRAFAFGLNDEGQCEVADWRL